MRLLSTFLLSLLCQVREFWAQGTVSVSLRSSLQTDDGENLSVFGCRGGPVKFVVSETVLLLGLHKTGLRNIEGGGEVKPRPLCVGEDGIGGTEMPGKDIASDLLPVVLLSPLGPQDWSCAVESGLDAEMQG